VFVLSLRTSEYTVTVFLNNINKFVMEIKCVTCEVETELLLLMS